MLVWTVFDPNIRLKWSVWGREVNKQHFVGSVGKEKKVAATVREEFWRRRELSYRSRHNRYTREEVSPAGLFYTSLFSQRWKAKAYTLGKRGRNALRRDKQCAVVCGRKPHHLKPTTPPVTHCTKPTFLSTSFCNSACNVLFSTENVQQCHSVGRIYARPSMQLGMIAVKNASQVHC